MPKYDHSKIEKKWQKEWIKSKLYKTLESKGKKKFYVLDMFPYPSGEGLHVGHPRGYIGTDIVSRMKKMQGFNVLHPMGWDAFGLPAEQYAIKNKIHPEIAVKKNIKRYKEQLSIMGFNYDWDREVNTTDPAYYKWTQWIFLQMWKYGLAFESFEPINWCPSCQTGLANEDLEQGLCERCGTQVEKKPMRQWVLKITKYADRMLEDLDALDWPTSIKESQRNWIGRSEGAEIEFDIKGEKEKIKVFTTRADTLYGATYVVLAPEHELVKKFENKIKNFDEVKKYIDASAYRSEIERTAEKKDKTGVELKGIKAINPASSEEISVWIADYVLAGHGTGAIMAVPQHDERDREFAEMHHLPIIDKPLADKDEIIKKVGGVKKVAYKLKDWVFARQRYWGEPIPLIHCLACGVVPVPEKELPVKLPKVKSYEPTGTGESPLAAIDKWVNVKCPECDGPAKRETNTMPQWAGSSWYYLRYIDPKNKKSLVDKKKEGYWSPVDLYVGGTEHATRHLIYARFWHKFLYDIGAVNYKEPFMRLQNQGLIMASDGRKMSKRWGNVVNPDDVVKTYGADTMRVYEMFMGPFDQSVAWNTDSIMGSRRFLEKVWRISEKFSSANNLLAGKKKAVPAGEDSLPTAVEKILHKTIKKVSEDIASMTFNTAISAMMILANEMEKSPSLKKDDYKKFLQILAPFAPHMTEELWRETGEKKSIYLSSWPSYDESKIKDETLRIAVQVNGKVRAEIEVSADISEAEVRDIALSNEVVKNWLKDQPVRRFIYVKGKLANIVV
jgi:leucyl-tRNA synthetase